MKPRWSDETDANGKRTIRYKNVIAVNGKYGPADLKVYFQAQDSATMQIAPDSDEMLVAVALMAKAQWDTFRTEGDLAVGNWVQEGIQLASIREIMALGENLALKWENFRLRKELERVRQR